MEKYKKYNNYLNSGQSPIQTRENGIRENNSIKNQTQTERGDKFRKEMLSKPFQMVTGEIIKQYRNLDGGEKIIEMLGGESGVRVDVEKHPNSSEEDRRYVIVNERLFQLKDIINNPLLGTEEERGEILELIQCSIPLKNLSEISKEMGNRILNIAKKITQKYQLERHWKKDKRWELAECILVKLLNQFLKNYVAIRASRYDDIADKLDIFLVPLKEGLPHITLDATIKTEKDLKSKEIKSGKFNIKEPRNIKHGISHSEGEEWSFKEISKVPWFFIRIDAELLNKFINVINQENVGEELINNIEKNIFAEFYKNIAMQERKLKKEKIYREGLYKKLKEKYKNMNISNNKKEKIAKELRDIEEELRYLEETLKKMQLFIQSI